MLPSTSSPRVSSVTVAFNPSPERLAQQLAALRGQVDELVIVDNGSRPPVQELLRSETSATEAAAANVRFVVLPENEGVARGFNVGIEEARRRGARFVLLLDDDSVPAGDMVPALVEGHRRCAERSPGDAIAAVGPRIDDLRDRREYPFVRLGWLSNRHLFCRDQGDGLVACDFLISSGSLIGLDAFAAIGPFDETLFIDNVDLEWCFRARSRAFTLHGVCAARLDHRLGDRRRPVVGGAHLVIHSPERLYYMTRNRLMLYRRPYMPLKWKLKDVLRALAKFAATMLLIAPRLEYARMSARAVRDAAARRGGKLRG